MLRIAISLLIVAVALAEEQHEFVPLQGWDNHAVARVFPRDGGGAILVGLSHKKANPPTIARSSFALWLADVNAVGVVKGCTEIPLSSSVLVSDLNYFDGSFLQSSRNRILILLPTGDENLYELQDVSLTMRDGESPLTNATKLRARLPKGFSFGCGGKGSGGIYMTSSGKLIVAGLGMDGKSVVALSGNAFDKLTECFRYQTQSQLDVIGCADNALFWENGDLDQFGGGSRKIEGALLGVDNVPRAIAKGKFVSLVKMTDGYSMLLDRSPVFPQAEHVVYCIKPNLEWANTLVLGNSSIAVPYSAAYVPMGAGKFGAALLDAKSGVISVYDVTIGAKESALRHRFSGKDVDSLKGMLSLQTGGLLAVLNVRNVRRQDNKVLGVNYGIRLVAVE